MPTSQKENFKSPHRRYVIIFFGSEIDQICLLSSSYCFVCIAVQKEGSKGCDKIFE